MGEVFHGRRNPIDHIGQVRSRLLRQSHPDGHAGRSEQGILARNGHQHNGRYHSHPEACKKRLRAERPREGARSGASRNDSGGCSLCQANQAASQFR